MYYHFIRPIIRSTFVILLACLVVAFCLRRLIPSKSLPFEAVRLVNTNEWRPTTNTSFIDNLEGSSQIRTPVYAWLSHHEVLACRKHGNFQFEFFRFDTTSNKETNLVQLNEKIAESSIGLEDGFRLSPDGKFILWHTTHFGASKAASWHIASLDATYFSDYTVPNPFLTSGDFAPASNGITSWDWEQDSQHWTFLSDEITGTLRFLRYAKDDNTVIKPIEISLGSKYNKTWSGEPVQLIGFTDEGRSLSTTWNSALSTINILEASIKQPFQPIRVFSIHLPHHSLVQSVYLSPQKNKLLWDFITRTVPHTPSTKFQHGDVEEIWVSNADGNNMKRVSLLPLDQYSPLTSVFWMPDGKQASFIYDNNLYKIQVP